MMEGYKVYLLKESLSRPADMKSFSLLYFKAIFLLIGCNNSTSKTSMLSQKNLKSRFITLQAELPYTLKTPKGGIIKTASNSFKVVGNGKIRLEIVEKPCDVKQNMNLNK